MKEKWARRVAAILVVLALSTFAAAAGVFIRDLGARYQSGSSGPIDPGGDREERFYAYELTYELAVFSTVRVRTVVKAAFGDWQVEFESNGSLVVSFRPEFPGLHLVLVENLEPARGQIGVSVLLQSSLPPELETSLLNPLLYLTATLLVAFAILSSVGRRGPAADGASPRDTEEP